MLDANLENLILEVERDLRLAAKEPRTPDGFRAALLASYVIRSRLNLRALEVLSREGIYSECAPLLTAQLEMRLISLLLCSGFGNDAVAWLHWHDELRRRLRYLKLVHLENEAAHMSAVLTQAKSHEDQQLLEDWYKQKPKSDNPDGEWLSHWPLWPIEKLLREIQKNIVEDPRLRKELDNLSNFAFENPAGANLASIKRYALIDEELNAVTFMDAGEIHWPDGPLALASAAVVDMLYEMSLAFNLPHSQMIDAQRLTLKKSGF